MLYGLGVRPLSAASGTRICGVYVRFWLVVLVTFIHRPACFLSFDVCAVLTYDLNKCNRLVFQCPTSVGVHSGRVITFL
jgi:hypothetical protein